MFGDTMLANGTVYPEATVEARRYRLRIINACQARFLNLQLYVDDGSPDGITLHILRFKVVAATSKDAPLRITPGTDLTPDLTPFLVPPGTAVHKGVLHLPPGVRVRQLTLNETFDDYGRLLQLLGTNHRVKGGF